MTHYVKMTIDEYNELVTIQNEPSNLLKAENKNLKHHLDIAQTKIKELEAGLSQYIIGGMKPISTPSAEPIYTVTPTPIKAFFDRRKWTAAEHRVIHSASEIGIPVEEVAIDLNRTLKSILSRIAVLGYRTKHGFILRKEK
jgi:hypothetical protein